MSSDSHRVFALECRLEQMRASVDEARAEAHRARERLAETTARQAERTRVHQLLHEELAAAREELALLHRRLEHSEALRAQLEGRLFEGTTPEDAEELVRLRGEVAAYRDLTAARDKIVKDLRARVGGLVAGRETLLSRVTEWQCAVQEGNADAVDLAEFIAMLTGDILEIEHRRIAAEQRGASLEEQLLRAREQGYVDKGATRESDAAGMPEAPGEPETRHESEPRAEAAEATLATGAAETSGAADMAVSAAQSATHAEAIADRPAVATARPATTSSPPAAPLTGDNIESRIDILIRLGRSGEPKAFDTISPSLTATEPRVRAAAYQALGNLLEHDAARLEPHIRRGVTDSDSRVRRRVVLAATAARGLDCQALLEPLQRDADPQVRRLVKEVLRRMSPGPDATGRTATDRDRAGPDHADEPTARVAGAQGS
jgi:hypothetical protein